jgi:hypothetical protein
MSDIATDPRQRTPRRRVALFGSALDHAFTKVRTRTLSSSFRTELIMRRRRPHASMRMPHTRAETRCADHSRCAPGCRPPRCLPTGTSPFIPLGSLWALGSGHVSSSTPLPHPFLAPHRSPARKRHEKILSQKKKSDEIYRVKTQKQNTHFSTLNHARSALYTSTKYVFQTISGVQVASATEGPGGGVSKGYERCCWKIGRRRWG